MTCCYAVEIPAGHRRFFFIVASLTRDASTAPPAFLSTHREGSEVMSLARFKTWFSRAVPALLVLGSATAAAAQGTVTGRVTDAANGQPVPEVRVFVVSTNIFAVTNADGRYTVRNV